MQLFAFADSTKRIVHHLQEAVDLLVFVISRRDDLPVRREDSHIDQRRHDFPLRQDVVLHTVVLFGRRGGVLVRLAAEHRAAAFRDTQVVFV